MIDIQPDHLELIRNILDRHIPGIEVRAFGSRVSGQKKPYSDLDLVIVGQKQLPQKAYYQLKDAFEESSLPFRIDLLDWHRISSSFRRVIEQAYQVIQKGT
jgi:type I restriction enzyme S subunit